MAVAQFSELPVKVAEAQLLLLVDGVTLQWAVIIKGYNLPSYNFFSIAATLLRLYSYTATKMQEWFVPGYFWQLKQK